MPPIRPQSLLPQEGDGWGRVASWAWPGGYCFGMPEWVTVAGAILGILGGMGGAVAIVRERGLRDTLDTYREGNQGLRELWDIERKAREDDQGRHALEMRQQDESCQQRLAEQDRKIARLDGQVHTLQSGIVGALVSELKDALVDAVHAAMNSPERRTL